MVAGHSCLASPSVCSTSFQVRCLDGPYLPFFRMGNKKGVARRLLQEERCGRAPVKVLAWVWYTNCTRRAKFFCIPKSHMCRCFRASSPTMSPGPGK